MTEALRAVLADAIAEREAVNNPQACVQATARASRAAADLLLAQRSQVMPEALAHRDGHDRNRGQGG